MNAEKSSKINHLLTIVPPGVVLLSSWLKGHGYSLDLLKQYRRSGWLESIGTGAMIRSGDKVDYYGATYSLQHQANLKVHIGGRTAFSLLGKAHYLELATKKVVLFGAKNVKLPAWFLNHDWHVECQYHSSAILPPTLGLVEVPIKTFKIKISNAARAMIECLHLAPHNQELSECYEFMESLNNLHPKTVQTLFEQCTSIKVKRLFLCLAERLNHEWVHYLDTSKIDLGKGKRSIIKNGILDPKYNITIPTSWEKQF